MSMLLHAATKDDGIYCLAKHISYALLFTVPYGMSEAGYSCPHVTFHHPSKVAFTYTALQTV